MEHVRPYYNILNGKNGSGRAQKIGLHKLGGAGDLSLKLSRS